MPPKSGIPRSSQSPRSYPQKLITYKIATSNNQDLIGTTLFWIQFWRLWTMEFVILEIMNVHHISDFLGALSIGRYSFGGYELFGFEVMVLEFLMVPWHYCLFLFLLFFTSLDFTLAANRKHRIQKDNLLEYAYWSTVTGIDKTSFVWQSNGVIVIWLWKNPIPYTGQQPKRIRHSNMCFYLFWYRWFQIW